MSPPPETPRSEPRATLNAIWQTRPSRRQTDRKIAGVAAAIARRYDIDPVLIRIAFVVAAFYGVGILLYLAAWLALPADPVDPPRGRLASRNASTNPLVLVAVVVAGLAGAGSLLSGDPGVLAGLAVVGGLLYLLHQSRGERGLAVAAYTPPTPGADAGAGPIPGTVAGASGAGVPGAVGSAVPSVGAAGSAVPSAAAVGSVPPGPVGSVPPGPAGSPAPGPVGSAPGEAAEPDGTPRPPAWDPLGAAPFAWDLPEPASTTPPTPPSPPRRRSRLTLVTMALALLAGGITAAIALSVAGTGGIRIVFGVMLAVVGLGLVVGAFRRTGGGLVALAIPLLLLTYAATKAPDRGDWRGWQGAGDLRAAPKTVAEVQPAYARSVGSINLDLSKLDLTSPSALTAPGAGPTTTPPNAAGPGPAAAQPGPAAAQPAPTTPVPAPTPAPTTTPAPSATAPPTTAAPNPPPGAAAAPVPGAPTPTGAPVPHAVVPLGPPADNPVRSRISLDAGEIRVKLPADADVRLRCHADVGEVECLDGPGKVAGPNSNVEVTDLGEDGAPGGRPLELEISVRTGSVEVTRD